MSIIVILLTVTVIFFCPAVYIMSPLLIQDTITFTLTTSNIGSTPLSMYDYYCRFQFQDANGNTMITDRIATQSNGIFTCTAPPSDQIPQLAEGQGIVIKYYTQYVYEFLHYKPN